MFTIENKSGKSSVFFLGADDEFSGVIKIAKKVCGDVEKVTEAKPELRSAGANADVEAGGQGGAVIFGTIDKSDFINKVIQDFSLSDATEKIRGKRESFVFAVTADKIVIFGSDKRGTIYGLFRLSELMGVSPLVDWAGVLPLRHEKVELTEGVFVSREPSVRFRGFFINDEWPAFGNWCNRRFGGFNAECYEHVFELLLRLKGNYLWPAMWSARFSDDGPGIANAELADELGVIMGASHHEPCCRAGEEYRHLRGPGSPYGDAWNFRTNRDGITKFWEDGLKRNGKFGNVITVGMRGEADTAIMQNATLADNINLLRDVIRTQNRLIRENVNQDLSRVPRMLALYKEVEPYFYGDKHTKGLMDDPELDGVTLMLCDDNHGNLRTVPTEAMRNHNGGYGMYYHFDYHGSPFSYEWLNTTALPKVKEQMTAAYEFGIRDLWIVNVGDVLTNEYPLSYFLDLAYDYDTHSKADFSAAQYTKKWADVQFAYFDEEKRAEAAEILCKFTKLTHARCTECLQADTYHPVNFGESDKTLREAESLILRAEELKKSVPAEQEAGFFSQLYLPVCGNMNVLRMQLYAGKNRWFASHGALVANVYADKVRECYAFDKKIVDECDTIADGRFYAMAWSEHFGFTVWCEAANRYPEYRYVEPTRKRRIIAWIDGEDFTTTGQDWTKRDLYLTAFKNPDVVEARVKVACCNEGGLIYNTSLECDWLSFEIIDDEERLGGKTGLDTIILKIDRKKWATAAEKTALLKITGDDGHGANILVNVHIDASIPADILGLLNGQTSAAAEPAKTAAGKHAALSENTFIQTQSYVSMEAVHFTSRGSGADGSHFEVLSDYGKTLGAVKAFPVTISYKPDTANAPYVAYDFVLQQDFAARSDGAMAFDFYLNPSNPAFKDNKLQFAVEVNGKRILKDAVDSETFVVGDNQEPWSTDVTNNIRIATVYAECRAGVNTLKVLPVTPNLVLEKIVIHGANTTFPQSYLGAPETYRVQAKNVLAATKMPSSDASSVTAPATAPSTDTARKDAK